MNELHKTTWVHTSVKKFCITDFCERYSTNHRWISFIKGQSCRSLILLLLAWKCCWKHSQVTDDLIHHDSHVTSFSAITNSTMAIVTSLKTTIFKKDSFCKCFSYLQLTQNIPVMFLWLMYPCLFWFKSTARQILTKNRFLPAIAWYQKNWKYISSFH